ncbi:1-phosphatidylinositol-4-phosphate 5-kinases [Striga asiatica]|uniref:1-phosphatidylinositol-4-phosphate 5-kinases n=1 Tax=Striga asiatica TaxID=4170 RepID=A0A5A7QRX3_STRAF|nr:1-phosphatidylinositol-4-phosphate 5-kinases [Striga asiatica]
MWLGRPRPKSTSPLVFLSAHGRLPSATRSEVRSSGVAPPRVNEPQTMVSRSICESSLVRAGVVSSGGRIAGDGLIGIVSCGHFLRWWNFGVLRQGFGILFLSLHFRSIPVARVRAVEKRVENTAYCHGYANCRVESFPERLCVFSVGIDSFRAVRVFVRGFEAVRVLGQKPDDWGCERGQYGLKRPVQGVDARPGPLGDYLCKYRAARNV